MISPKCIKPIVYLTYIMSSDNQAIRPTKTKTSCIFRFRITHRAPMTFRSGKLGRNKVGAIVTQGNPVSKGIYQCSGYSVID